MLSYYTLPMRVFLQQQNRKLLLVAECWSTSVVNIAKALYSLPLNFLFLSLKWQS